MKRLLAVAKPRFLTVLMTAAAGLLAVRLVILFAVPASTEGEPDLRVAARLEAIAPAAGHDTQSQDAGKAGKNKAEKKPPVEKAGETPADGKSKGKATARARRDALTSDPSLYGEAEISVLQDLQARREALDKRERDVVLREGLLKAAEKRVGQKIAELKTLKRVVDGLIKRRERANSKKIRSLITIYGKMKPADAARILSRLDMPVLLDVLQGMKETKVAPILAAMDPQKARDITTNMAARQDELRLPPKTGS